MKKKLWLLPCIILLIGLLTGGCSNKEEGEDGMEHQSVAGHWTGGIKIPDQPLHIQIDLQQEEKLDGMISIPAQGLKDYPLKYVNIEEDDIKLGFDLQGQLITLNGNLDSEKITGTFKQSEQAFDFELFKADGLDEVEGEWLEVRTSEDTLKGELLMPDKGDRPPVMLIIPGSGPTDRNGNSPAGQNNSLKRLAEELAELGIASVRYDKRGAGENKISDFEQQDMRFEQFVDDASAWLEQLKSDERFGKVGVVGHSQGSLVGMVAGKKQGADLFISLAGAGHPIDQVMQDQLKEQLPDPLLKKSQAIFSTLQRGEPVGEVPAELMSVFRPEIQSFLVSWMAYDPASEIKKLNMPALIINGTYDVQVPESEAKQLKQAYPDAELHLIDGMNHVLKKTSEDRQRNMAAYWNPNQPLADGLMKEINDFLVHHDWMNQ